MASKPFYSMEEVCEKLGKSADEVKNLVREGTLREFRDAGKIFFKAEDIEKLSAEAAPESPAPSGGGEIELESAGGAGPSGESGTDDLTSLTDSTGGTSIIGLEPLEDEEPPSAAAPPPPPKEPQEDTVITASGIGVFDDDELEIDADPMAKTQITEGATDDQVSLEGAGSGSGLLDLAREADDTALGADLLDEIYPGEEEGAGQAVAAEEEAPAAEAEASPAEEAPAAAEEEAAAVLEEPVAAEEVVVRVAPSVADPLEGLLTGLLVGAMIVMGVASTVAAGVIQGFLPDYGAFLADGERFYFFLGGSVLLAVITLLVGWFVGKAFAPRRR
jgi:hypothetical protein